MPSHDFRIEVFIDEYGNWSYACPEYELHGYSDIIEIILDIVRVRNGEPLE